MDPLPPRPLEVSFGDEPSLNETMRVIKAVPTWKALGPDDLPAELLKLDHPEIIQCFHHILANVWITGEVPQQCKEAIIKVLHKRRAALIAATTKIFRLLLMQASVAENRCVPALATTARIGAYSLSNSAAFVRHDQKSKCCSSCDDCKNSDEREKFPYTFASLTYRKRTTLSTESCCGWCSHASACQPRCLRSFATTACGLECVQMIASARNRLMSRRGCDKAVCCRRCCLTCSALL